MVQHRKVISDYWEKEMLEVCCGLNTPRKECEYDMFAIGRRDGLGTVWIHLPLEKIEKIIKEYKEKLSKIKKMEVREIREAM